MAKTRVLLEARLEYLQAMPALAWRTMACLMLPPTLSRYRLIDLDLSSSGALPCALHLG